jgi:hypothetical protein
MIIFVLYKKISTKNPNEQPIPYFVTKIVLIYCEKKTILVIENFS